VPEANILIRRASDHINLNQEIVSLIDNELGRLSARQENK
jgi:hypothetical protein